MVLSERIVVSVGFSRDKELIVTVTNGITISNSTLNPIKLQIDHEETQLNTGEKVKFPNLDALIQVYLMDGWSDPISLSSDSQVRYKLVK